MKKFNLAGVLLAVPAAMIVTPVFAQTTPSAAETGVQAGFDQIEAIINLAVPLMIGIAAVVVAASWGLRMLKKG